MPRRYVERADGFPTLRGRLQVTRQISALEVEPSRIVCRYDALTLYIASNHLMETAICRLSLITCVMDNQRRLRGTYVAYAKIADMPVALPQWDEMIVKKWWTHLGSNQGPAD